MSVDGIGTGETVRGRQRKFRTIRSQRERWQAQYRRNLMISDTVVVFGAVASAQLMRFGEVANQPTLSWGLPSTVGYQLVSATLAILWLALLAGVDCRSTKIIGQGPEEYRRIVSATFLLFGLISILSMLFRMDIARGYLAIAFPLGTVALLASRWIWRMVATRRYKRGQVQEPLLVVGTRQAAANIASKFSSEPELGYRVVGICTPEGPTDEAESLTVGEHEFPVVGLDMAVIDAVERTNAMTVAISPTDHLSPTEIRRLMWDLEPKGVALVVTSGLIDVANQRIHSRPIAGMGMLHIEKPQYGRAISWAKRAFDICFALVAILLASPVMVVAAIAVRFSSPGPIFYMDERIGMNGKRFRMFKFRSMYDGSHKQAAKLIEAAGSQPVFFKMKDDPRVTPVGRWMRKYSIDELPQFFNVLRGEMSVVGPRPQVLREVESYDDLMRRRLMVRPGVTGLWQVSGRSDLPLDDAIRLDLSYVENWTMAQDVVIIARTLRAVMASQGAY
ncbi:UDP-phosphate galactose phosphotransferase [Mycobacterium goodii]|nr:UDP-phosphate galactose phosphotransferase [Mycolicibacterium goodii]